MINKSDIFQVERPWGNFRQFTKSELSTVKILTIKPNEMLSLQNHKNRDEFWHIVTGSGIVEIEEIKTETNAGDEHVIRVGEKHRLRAGPDGMVVLEIATGEFDEEDITHFEDKYGRV